MSVNGGDIFIRLELDDGQYKVAVVNAGKTMAEYKRTLDSTADSVKRLESIQSSMGRKFRDLVLTLGNLRFVAMDINDVFLRLPMSILKTAGEIERMQVLMRGLSKETTDYKRTMEGVRDFNFVVGMAKNAPFEIGALSDSFVKLKTAGIDPTNGSMQALVDSVARFGGNGETLKRASVAIQQMAGKGVISMEELRQQLGEAVPTAMQEMANGMGMTMAELAKAVSKGTLEASGALNKMLLQMRISNMGASVEMMTTWGGMTSRLKTEWDLTAKAIADAGFGDAAKRAVSDMTATLQSPEFVNFGKNFGAGLGEAVNSLADMARWVIRNGEEIKIAAQAWVAYKLIFSGIVPMSRGLNEAIERGTQSLRQNTTVAMRNAEANRQTMYQGAQMSFESARAREREAAARLASDQRELASVRQKNAQIIADEARLQARLASMRNAERKYNANNIGDQQRLIRDIEALGHANAEANIRQRELSASVVASSAAYATAQRATAMHLATMGTLSATTRAAQIATVAMTGATRAFGFVLNAMGGWVGVAITALTALYFVYQDLAGAAERYNDAARQAKQGFTTKEDLETLKKGLNEAAEEYRLAKLNSETTRTGFPIMRNKSEAEKAADTARLIAAAKKYQDAQQNIQVAQRNLVEQAGRDASSLARLNASRALGEIDSQTAQAVQKIEARRNSLKESMRGAGEREILAADQKLIKERTEVYQSGLRRKIALEEAAAKAAAAKIQRAGISASDLAGANIELKAAQESLAALRNELEASQRAVDAPIKILADPKKGAGAAKADPLENLLVQLRARRDQLAAELDGFSMLDGKTDKAEGQIAKIRELYGSGQGSKGRKTDKEDPRLKQAEEIVRETEKTRKAIEERKETARGIEATTQYIEQMKPAYQEAMDFLADPFGATRNGSEERKLLRFLKGNEDAVKAYASSVGKTVEELKASLKSDALAIDSSRAFEQMAQETKTINASLVSDSRETARLRAEADNERHRKYMQNLIDERKAAGAPDSEIESMQRILDENTKAKGEEVKEKFKGPMKSMLDEWLNTTKQMEKASVGWLDKSTDALTEFVMTGKADFGSFAKSIIGDIIKIMTQQLVAKAVTGAMGFFGFANGGIMTSGGSVPLKKYATGGIATSPQLALYGEGRQPEAYVPLPDGRTIPVTMKGAAGGGNVVSIQINVQSDGSGSSSSEGQNAKGYESMANRVREVVIEELAEQKRPGGMLYS